MRATLVFVLISLATLFVSSQAGSKAFNFGGWSGVVESFGKIDGVESKDHDQISSKAEQAIKKLIEKHLAGKKQAKQQAKAKNSAPVPQQPPASQAASEPQLPAQEPQLPVNQEQGAPIPSAPIGELPASINWDDHKATRDAINQKVPGGTEAVDALIKLLNENKSK